MWVPTTVAAQEVGVTDRTIRTWLRRDPTLGRRIGGRWRVDPDRLQRILDGTSPIIPGR